MNSDECSCSICEEAFDAGARMPRVLPCGHTYCHECLRQLSAKNFICPEDRSPIRVKSPDDLPKNFALLKLLQTVDSPPRSCRQHNRPFEFVCLPDRRRLCRLCIPFHSGHDVRNEKQSEQEMHSALDILQRTVGEVSQLLDKGSTERQISKLKESLALKRFEVKAKLKDEFEVLRRKLNELEEEASYKTSQTLEQLDIDLAAADELQSSITEISTSWLERSKKAVTSFSACQDDFYAEAEEFENSCFKNLIDLGKQLLDELERLNSTELALLDRRIHDLQFSSENIAAKQQGILQDFHIPEVEPVREVRRASLYAFNDSVYKESMRTLAFKTSQKVDFSGAGSLEDRGVEIAVHLEMHPTLRSLKLVRNKLSKKSMVAIFQALHTNTVLATLNISQNVVTPEALDALLDLLRSNSTLKEVSLQGNCRIPHEYKSKLSRFNTAKRRVNFN